MSQNVCVNFPLYSNMFWILLVKIFLLRIISNGWRKRQVMNVLRFIGPAKVIMVNYHYYFLFRNIEITVNYESPPSRVTQEYRTKKTYLAASLLFITEKLFAFLKYLLYTNASCNQFVSIFRNICVLWFSRRNLFTATYINKCKSIAQFIETAIKMLESIYENVHCASKQFLCIIKMRPSNIYAYLQMHDWQWIFLALF